MTEPLPPGLTRVVRHGHRHAAAVLALPGLRVVVGPAAVVDPALGALGRAQVERLRADGARLRPGPTLALDRLEDDVLYVREAGYLDHVGIGRAVAREPEARERATALAQGDPLRRGGGRAAALGVSVVTTVRHPGGRAVLLGRRADDLPVEPGRLHVVPSGMVEPGDRDPVRATAGGELTEELGLEAGPGAFRTLGLGWDLRRLTPEALLLLELDLDGEQVVASAPRDEVSAFELVPVEALDAFWAAHGPDELTPPAAAALALFDPAV